MKILKNNLLFGLLGSFLLVGCGPSRAVLRTNVLNSPRKKMAMVPLAENLNQKDLRKFASETLLNDLKEFGFVVVGYSYPQTTTPPAPVLPLLSDVLAYARELKVKTVLVGKIEKALDRANGRPAKFKNEQINITDSRGMPIHANVKVEIAPAKAEVQAQFALELKLIDVDSEAVLWQQSSSDSVPQWTLSEIARFQIENMMENLAETFFNKKL